MSTSSVWVGIDVSQKQLDLYVHPLGKTLSVTNDPEGIEQLIASNSQYGNSASIGRDV